MLTNPFLTYPVTLKISRLRSHVMPLNPWIVLVLTDLEYCIFLIDFFWLLLSLLLGPTARFTFVSSESKNSESNILVLSV